MKKCPKCGTQYSDVTLSFCLQDGTPLIVPPQADTPTVVMGETETIARGGRVGMPVDDPNADTWDQSRATHIVPPPAQTKRSNTVLAVGLTMAGMLLLFAVIGIAAIAFYRNSQQASAPNTSVRSNTDLGSLSTNSDRSTPYVAASPMSSPIASPPPNPTPRMPPATTPPPILSSYPSTTRLKFARGAYSTSFSGDINPGDTRSLVLGCRSGQSLSANVSSGGECITFRGSGTSLRTTTNGGDNYLTLTNKCSSAAHFTISISVI